MFISLCDGGFCCQFLLVYHAGNDVGLCAGAEFVCRNAKRFYATVLDGELGNVVEVVGACYSVCRIGLAVGVGNYCTGGMF